MTNSSNLDMSIRMDSAEILCDNLGKSIKMLLSYLSKKSTDYLQEDDFADIFGDSTINFSEPVIENRKNKDIFRDGTFISTVTNPIIYDYYSENNATEALIQTAAFAQIQAGVRCYDGEYIDLEGLKTALSIMGTDFGSVSDINSFMPDKLSKIKKISINSYTRYKK